MREQDIPPLRVAVIIGSTREGRVGEQIGRWFLECAERRADLEPAVLDLVDFDFPARCPHRATEPTREFSAGFARADAFVVVTPEYNRSFPASLNRPSTAHTTNGTPSPSPSSATATGPAVCTRSSSWVRCSPSSTR